jgi:hypothetical protein
MGVSILLRWHHSIARHPHRHRGAEGGEFLLKFDGLVPEAEDVANLSNESSAIIIGHFPSLKITE